MGGDGRRWAGSGWTHLGEKQPVESRYYEKKSPWHAFCHQCWVRSSLWCAGAATCSKSFLRVKCEARRWHLMMSLGPNPNSPVKLVPVSPLYIPGCLHIQVFKLDWIKINSHLHRLIFPSVSVAKLIADWHEVATANQKINCNALLCKFPATWICGKVKVLKAHLCILGKGGGILQMCTEKSILWWNINKMLWNYLSDM